MDLNVITYIVFSVTVTSLLWYIYVAKLKNQALSLKLGYEQLSANFDKEISFKSTSNIQALEKTIFELESKIAAVKHESFTEGYNKGRGEFSIKIFPYKEENKSGDDGWLINDIYHEIILGYQYQLFMNGIPLLQPAVIVEEILTEAKREVDYKKVEFVTSAIESRLLPIIADSKGVIKLIKNSNK